MAKRREAIEVGTGDVFVDLGFADAGERRLRVQLAMKVNEIIKDLRLTQVGAAKVLNIPQPHVSELKNFKLNRFSSERLLHFLTVLDRDVEIVIRRKSKSHSSGQVSVLVAA
jgi:predicted XRE-type DNA-binding protein